MRAGIYARKSTDQKDRAEETKSVTLQIAQARAFAEKQGWAVAEDAIFQDDGISGTIASRPGIDALLVAAQAKRRPFDALVVLDLDRLARELVYVPQTLDTLINELGIELWTYGDGQKVKYTTDEDKLMVYVRLFGGAVHATKSGEKTTLALREREQNGWVTGEVPFGYRRREITGANGERSHVEYEIAPDQAKIVVRIFELAAAGLGLLKTVKALNAAGVPHPDGQDWSTAGVREILKCELYHGERVCGKSKWVHRGRSKRKVRVPESEWRRYDLPQVRIVSEELWQAACGRKAQTSAGYLRGPEGHLGGKPESGLDSRFLLSGFARCACGAKLVPNERRDNRPGSRSRRVSRVYECYRRRTKGACAAPAVPLDQLHQAVIWDLSHTILTPELLDRCLSDLATRAATAPEQVATQRAATVAELAKVAGELKRLGDAVARGAAVDTLLAGIREREGRRSDLQAKLEHLDGQTKAADQDVATVEELREAVTTWNRLLNLSQEGTEDEQRERTKLARQVLRKLGVERVDVQVLPDGQLIYNVRGSFEHAITGRVRKSLAAQAEIDALEAAWATVVAWDGGPAGWGGPEAFPELEGEVRDHHAVAVPGAR